MGRLEDVIDTIKVAIETALQNAAIVPPTGTAAVGKVITNWPDEQTILNVAKGLRGPIVSIVPIDPSTPMMTTKSRILARTSAPQPLTVVADSTGQTLTFGGSVIAGLNVGVFIGFSLVAFVYKTLAGDDLNSLAAAVASRINAAGIGSVHATATGASVTTTGPSFARVNIGSVATLLRKVGARSQRLQVTVWANEDVLRGNIVDAITSAIGTQDYDARWIAMPDTTWLWVRQAWGPRWKEESIADSQVKRSDLAIDVQYNVVQSTPQAQVVAFDITLQAQGGTTHAVGG